MNEQNWWRGAAIYQIYPRSFQDSNGDGIGDLAGITARMPYLAQLGIDAIWISPFFKSPMLDFGYDVSDYRQVDPIFGDLGDFDRMIAAAHQHGLKVLIDQVISHTSDQHAWFKESRGSRDNPKQDWYVWVDPQADGSPPNNWQSIFGGSAWQWDTRRCQYYLHNFLSSQPDLNFHHPEVQDAVLDATRFWLERGVDGFRLDTVNFYFHDQALRSNPPQPAGQYAVGVPRNNPYALQVHVYDKTRPENLAFLQRFRALTDAYPGIATIGEIGDDNQYRTLAAYTAGNDKLHMAYTFNLLAEQCSPRFIHGVLDEFQRETAGAWACWSLGNHDVPRVVSRWQELGDSPLLPAVLLAMLGSLRGSICLYQGEELALAEAVIPYEQIQDPYGKTMWPDFAGRDGCRTPMPWQADGLHAGFSSGAPWLPIPAAHLPCAADRAEADPQSTLHRYRHFLRWRKQQPALIHGEMELLAPSDQVVAMIRRDEAQTVLCLFNLSNAAAIYALPAGMSFQALGGHGFHSEIDGGQVTLPPYQAFFGTPG
ncbi:alpha-glucosidase family protein [Collimonas silvisoli]|uniref:alpha-glucosidase family protein n=1 Tax=Collimonas silvisoli TaxID=2825884 RepID=UPI001B8C4853|nr:alpha-glucosidase family protein [Collimonas silvisoli]